MTALSGFKLLQNGYAVILIGQLQNRSAAAQFCRSLNSASVVLYFCIRVPAINILLLIDWPTAEPFCSSTLYTLHYSVQTPAERFWSLGLCKPQ